MGAGEPADPAAVVGEWDVLTKVLGEFRRSLLTVSGQDGTLAATVHDEVDGEMEVTAVRFEDGILTYEYVSSGSQSTWGKGSVGKLNAWLQVRGDTFRGALSLDVPPEGDYAVEGRRRSEGFP